MFSKNREDLTLTKLLKEKNIKVIEAEFKKCPKAKGYIQDKHTVYINRNVSAIDKKYLILKEISIIINRGEEIKDSYDIDSTEQEEKYAIDILMPKKEVIKYYKSIAVPIVRHFQIKFKAPRNIVINRLNEIGLNYVR